MEDALNEATDKTSYELQVSLQIIVVYLFQISSLFNYKYIYYYFSILFYSFFFFFCFLKGS